MISAYDGFGNSPLVMEEVASEYASNVDQAISKFRIFTGEACADLYSQWKVVEAFRRAKERGVTTTMIGGPILSVVVSNYQRHSGILDLVKEDVISLYRRDSRGEAPHYRIIDESFAVVEDSHEPLELLHCRHVRNQADVKPLIGEFDLYLSRSDVVLSRDPWGDFIVLSPSQITTLGQYCTELFPGRRFSDLQGEELLRAFNDLQIAWCSGLKRLKDTRITKLFSHLNPLDK